MSADDYRQELEIENERLRQQLAEAESVLHAIQRGEIDAVVVTGPERERVFTLEGADHPYRLLVESMSEGAATLSNDGLILYANPRLASLLGTSRNDLTGARLGEWAEPPDSITIQQMLESSGSEPVSGELNLITSDGVALPVRASFSPLFLEGERFCCAIITDQSLARHHATLKEAAQRIREANERLHEADRRKDEFLATLAHELRNPLAPIASSVQIMRLPGVDSAVVEQARKTIERQVSHLVRLVDDLMDVSRISRDKFELRRERIALSAVVQSAVETCQPVIDARGQRLAVTLPAEPIWLYADLTRLAQAVANLLNNASKYSPDDADVRLTATVDGHEVVIRVLDSGIGIRDDVLPHIFDMFRQGDASDVQGRSGLGIGLTLVKSLVEMHDGSVAAKSDGAGRGSEFALHLPIADEGATVSTTPRSEPVAAPARRILVVDDNRDAAASLAMLLGHSGHHARTAHDGLEAIEAAQEFRPDAIMLDIGMPGLDGYEVAQRIRDAPWGREILLVALTGWGQLQDRFRSREAGFDHHFVKPVEYAALAELLGKDP